MKEIKVTDKDKLVELLQWSLESAGLGSKDMEKMVQAIHKQMESKDLEYDDYMVAFNQTLADFILAKYEAVIITSDEQVYGRNGSADELLFDGTDTKVFLDARF